MSSDDEIDDETATACQHRAKELKDKVLALTNSLAVPGGKAELETKLQLLEAANRALADAMGSHQPASEADEVGESVASSDGGYSMDEFDDDANGHSGQHQIAYNTHSSPNHKREPLFQRRERQRSRPTMAARGRHRSAGREGLIDPDAYIPVGQQSRKTIGGEGAGHVVRRERAYKRRGKARGKRAPRLRRREVWDKRVRRVPKRMRRYGPNLDVYLQKVGVHGCA